MLADDRNAKPAINPLTVPTSWSITPSPARMPDETESINGEIETSEATPTAPIIKQSDSSGGRVDADPVDFQLGPVIIPTVVVTLIAVLLGLVTFFFVTRMRRRHRKRSASRSSSSGDEEMKDNKVEALKTISSTTMTSTSSLEEDEPRSVSLQHWTSKKAISNRYESWHIGEIDQEWVKKCFPFQDYIKIDFSKSFFRCRKQRNKNQTEDGWEFPRHHLHVISILGEGCFGQVWKCQALNIAGELFY